MPTSIHADDECLGETLQDERGSAAHGPIMDWWQRGKLGNALYRPRYQSFCTSRLRVPLTGCLRVSSGRVFNGKTGQPAALPLHARPSMYYTATTVAGAHGRPLEGRGGRSKLLEWAKVSFCGRARNGTDRRRAPSAHTPLPSHPPLPYTQRPVRSAQPGL